MGTKRNDGLTLVFDFSMLNFRFTADYFRTLIGDIESHFAEPFMPVFVFSNHDNRRSIRRLGGDHRKARLLHLMQLTVRGVPCMYYGEELGMTDGILPRRSALDPIAHEFKFVPGFLFHWLGLTINRDVVRTPMQWDASRNAGFSPSDAAWLPVNPDFPDINVATETPQPDSLLHTIQDLLRIRTAEPALHSGSLQLVDGLPAGMLAYLRRWGGDEIAVFLNFTAAPVKLGPRGGRWISIYKLSSADDFDDAEILLSPFSGMILKNPGPGIQQTLEKARRRTS
jgi:oligo-1,6-glucosidase/alpha-glucosidase